MFYLDNNSGVSAMPKPAPQQSSAVRWFSEGDGNNNISWPGMDWFNIIQAELLSILVAANIVPDKTKFNQLALAIRAIVGSDALLKKNLLSEIKEGGASSQKKARENLGITDASLNKKGLVQLSNATDSTSETLAATPKAVKAANDNANDRVPTSGGSVAHLENATYYKTNPAVWYGGGAFADQYRNNAAPFLIPHSFESTKDVSQYLPIVKGISQTEYYGFGAAVSFGILRSGKNDFGSAVIHIIGDNGASAVYSFDATGSFNSPHHIVAGQGVYESGGAVRVYSSNNPPPAVDLSAFLQGVRLGGEIAIDQNGFVDEGKFRWVRVPPGCYMTGVLDASRSGNGRTIDNIDTVFCRPMQQNINGNWVAVTQI